MDYICITKCPELDYDNSRHCRISVITEEDLANLYDFECPCGNNSVWKEWREEDDK